MQILSLRAPPKAFLRTCAKVGRATELDRDTVKNLLITGERRSPVSANHAIMDLLQYTLLQKSGGVFVNRMN